MSPERLFLLLRARHSLVWGSMLFFGALALVISLIMTKQYAATARMLLDAREPDLLLQQQMGSYSVLAPTYIATQVDILHSDRVADIVIRTLGLDTNAQAIAQWEKNREGFFWVRCKDLRPSLDALHVQDVRSMLRLGAMFLVLQICISFAMSSDNLIVSHVLGPGAVTQYAVPARLYSLISVAVSLATAPLWPAYGEAIASGDHAWVRQTMQHSLPLAFGGALLAGTPLVSLAMPFVLHVWVGGQVQVTASFAAAMTVGIATDALRAAIAVLLNGAGAVRLQVRVEIIFAAVCVLLRLALTKWLGIVGIPLGSAMAFLLVSGVPYLRYLRRRFGPSEPLANVGP